MKLKVNNRVQGTKFPAGGYGRQSLPIKKFPLFAKADKTPKSFFKLRLKKDL